MISTHQTVSFFAGLGMILLVCSCHVREQNEIQGKDEAPGEHLYQMRAFPFDSINRTAVREGLETWKKASVARRSEERAWESAGPFNIGGRITALAIHPLGYEYHLCRGLGGRGVEIN